MRLFPKITIYIEQHTIPGTRQSQFGDRLFRGKGCRQRGQARRLGGGGSVGSVDPPPLVRTSSACHQNNLFITSTHVAIARENEITIHAGLATAGHPF